MPGCSGNVWADGTVKSVTVIGGSMVGIKIVELCQEAGHRVHAGRHGPSAFSRWPPCPDVSAEIERRLMEKGVTAAALASAVTSAEEMADRVTTVFADGERGGPADLLVLCIGTRARTALAREAGLEVGPRYRGQRLHGDLASPGSMPRATAARAARSCPAGHQIIGLWANAAYQGQTAGHCMAGDPRDLLAATSCTTSPTSWAWTSSALAT